MKKFFSIMSNLQTHHHFKLYFEIVDQHKGGKWFIHDIKHHKDNQLQSLEPPAEYPRTTGSALIPRPASNGMEKMCQRHMSN